MLIMPGAWLARLEGLLAGRPVVCGNVLLYLLASFFWRPTAPGSVAGNTLVLSH